MLFLLCCLLAVAGSLADNIAGECPNVKIQENLDFTKFSGSWYNVASFASDGRPIYDCATLDFQEDNLGYTLKETYVVSELGNRTHKSYLARVLLFLLTVNKVLQFPFFILSTDYEGYAIAYTCKTYKKKPKNHYVYSWVLSRNKRKLDGESLMKVEDALSKYTELAEHARSFVYKDFSDAECEFSQKFETDFFTSNFW
ncbi:hypothetical protein MSG28_006756 [Choristoneura fumiferana]|uniref:Uncharacterized protein n=1 Tax=Choristoneura fumiferana TaxID=7141 RepID=A0ACC0JL02_CHOFU|nr:hypothetical protein MSG28_006756 [Choristoneura fumiferana]